MRSMPCAIDMQTSIRRTVKNHAGSDLPPLDPFQLEAVRVRRNAVVAAGAGSGKTTVLARRFLELIRGGASVRSILALTFTRKAAAEMHERIQRLLLSQSAHPEVADALADFDEAQIATLDSFCLQLAGESPGRFGLRPDFVIDEMRVAEISREEALAFVNDRVESSVLQAFVDSNGYDSVVADFFIPIANQYFNLAQRHDFASMYADQASNLEASLREASNTLENLKRDIVSIKMSGSKVATAAQSAVASLVSPLQRISKGEYDELVRDLRSIKPKRPRRSTTRPEVTELRDLVDAFLEQRDLAILMADTMANLELIEGVMDLCGEFQSRVLERRSDLGVCSYADITQMAVATLRDEIAVREFYKRRYGYILIDEFQDNNAAQRDMLFLLAERLQAGVSGTMPDANALQEDKLFFVGDQKQSIYRFRGADVSVFKKLSLDLGTSVSLPVNYRSAPVLINFFNAAFSQIMSDAREPYEAEFEELRRSGASQEYSGSVKILFKPYRASGDPEQAEPDDSEAFEIATRIRGLVGSDQIFDAEGGMRSVAYEDIAIIIRATGSQIRYERAFRNMGIPYSVDSARSLFIESVFNDIYALLQIIVYPRDRDAYLAVLRSPLARLSDTASIRLLLDGSACFSEPSDVVAGLTDSDQICYEAAAAMYDSIGDTVRTGSISRAISEIWYDYGYRLHVLANPAHHGYLEHYDYLRRLATDSEKRGENIVTFLAFIRDNLGQYERIPDLEIMKRDHGGVRILTIHKSKGLEFPIVFFANTGYAGRDEDATHPYYFSDEFGLTVNIRRGDHRNYFYLRGRSETAAKELAELKRLAYVACTRAKYRLYICGCHTVRNRRSERVHLNMILAALGWQPELSPDEVPALSDIIEVIPDIKREALYTPPHHPSRDREANRDYSAAHVVSYPAYQRKEWTVTEAAHEVHAAYGFDPKILASAPPSSDVDISLRDESLEAAFGILCHAVLGQMIGQHFDRVTSHRPASDLRSDLQSALGIFGESIRDSVLLHAETICRNALNAEIIELLDGEVELEVPFVLEVARDVRVRGQIDCIILRSDTFTILDFKTDPIVRPGEYVPQMMLYRMAAEKWQFESIEAPTAKEFVSSKPLQNRRVRTLLVYLRHPRVVAVKDALRIRFPWQKDDDDRNPLFRQ